MTIDHEAAAASAAVAIVGGGFSGLLLAVQLRRRCPPGTQIHLIERTGRFGPGLAYSTENPHHLLNAFAGRMSAFPDRPSHFVEWLRARHAAGGDPLMPPPTEASLIPRRTYGAYVREILDAELREAGAEGALSLVRGVATGIVPSPHGGSGRRLSVMLDRAPALVVDVAVLAVGNFPPEAPPIADPSFYATGLYRGDPWAPDALSDLAPDAAVLLIGTGQTMVDTAVSLLDRGHRGPIHALSRRGLLPTRHAGGRNPAHAPSPLPVGTAALCRAVRAAIRAAANDGVDWRRVVDGLRPATQRLWQTASPEDRARFLRHLRPWWEIHRQRLAPEIADRIDAARSRGQLLVAAGRLLDCRIVAADLAEAIYRPRGGTEPRSLRVARVVNCSGPGGDVDQIADPLLRQLLDAGTIRPAPLRLGLDVTDACALRDRNGLVTGRLYAVGPVTRGAFWEITSVPDIREQCDALAGRIAQALATPERSHGAGGT
jgi:uncharacterized NAD(P)/FAD-binding protein YdhS